MLNIKKKKRGKIVPLSHPSENSHSSRSQTNPHRDLGIHRVTGQLGRRPRDSPRRWTVWLQVGEKARVLATQKRSSTVSVLQSSRFCGSRGLGISSVPGFPGPESAHLQCVACLPTARAWRLPHLHQGCASRPGFRNEN